MGRWGCATRLLLGSRPVKTPTPEGGAASPRMAPFVRGDCYARPPPRPHGCTHHAYRGRPHRVGCGRGGTAQRGHSAAGAQRSGGTAQRGHSAAVAQRSGGTAHAQPPHAQPPHAQPPHAQPPHAQPPHAQPPQSTPATMGPTPPPVGMMGPEQPCPPSPRPAGGGGHNNRNNTFVIP